MISENTKDKNDMIVYNTFSYQISYNEANQLIINNTFIVIKELGEGSYWKAFLVKRNYIHDDFIDDNFYVFKEGILSIKDDEAVFEKMNSQLTQSSDSTEVEVRVGMREYNILKTLNNKNIARLYESIIDTSLNKLVFVMEYCDIGCLMYLNTEVDMEKTNNLFYHNKNLIQAAYDLSIYKRKIQYDCKEIEFKKDYDILIPLSIHLFKQLANAIDYLHNEMLISHRDIKVDNIMIKHNTKTNTLDLKLIDFSISRKLQSVNDQIESSQGTDIFKAPELLEDYTHNPFKVDIYNFGTSLYCFLFNLDQEIKFEMNNEKALLLKEQNKTLYEILNNCLSLDPLIRYDILKIKNLLDIC